MNSISKRVRLTGAALAATLATSLVPAVAAADENQEPATKQFCEAYEGTFDWGLRTTFRQYILNPRIANGAINHTTGATGNDPKAKNFAFKFTPGAVTAEDADTGVIALQGDIHFTGHHGTLDTKVYNVRLAVDGKNLKVLGDYDANEVEHFAPGAQANRVTRKDQLLAEVELAKPFDFTEKGAIAFSGVPDVTVENNMLFNNAYNEDDPAEVLDPLGGSITCKQFPAPPAPPTTSAQPSTSAEPSTSAQPTTSAQPSTSVQPSTSAQPSTSVQPTTSEQSSTSQKPTTSGQTSVPTTAPTAQPQPEFRTLRDFLREFRGNPIKAILSVLSIGGFIAILTGIGGNLFSLFKR